MSQSPRAARTWLAAFALLAFAGATFGSFSAAAVADQKRPPQPKVEPPVPTTDPAPAPAPVPKVNPPVANPNPGPTQVYPPSQTSPPAKKTSPQVIETPRTERGDFRGNTAQWRERMRDERGNFRWQEFRGADIGLWFNRNSDKGLIIADVGTSGAIARFGFREGDRIVSVNGQAVVREGDFIRFLFAPEFRDRRVNVIVLRDGVEETIAVEPRVFVDEFASVDYDALDRVGLVVDERYPDRVIVVRVMPHSPAYYAGLRAGDTITSFRGQPIKKLADFVRTFDRLEPGNFALEVNRGDKPRNLELEIEAPAERRTTLKPAIEGRIQK